MKKLILAFALVLSTTMMFAQETRNSSDKDNGLSAFELQVSPGFLFLPKLNANWYFTEKMILRLEAPAVGYGSIKRAIAGEEIEVAAFLEMRKYERNKLFTSHGPTLAFQYTNFEYSEASSEIRAGYNLGLGYRMSEHFTAGTYVSPYISISEGDVDYLHGRLFAGALGNVYLAYRF